MVWMVDGSATWGNKGKEGLSRIINHDIRRQYDARQWSLSSGSEVWRLFPECLSRTRSNRHNLVYTSLDISVPREMYRHSSIPLLRLLHTTSSCHSSCSRQSSSRGMLVSNGEVMIDLKRSPMRDSLLSGNGARGAISRRLCVFVPLYLREVTSVHSCRTTNNSLTAAIPTQP